MWATWWLWALAAVALGLFEVLAPGYVALGFALGAGVVSLGLVTGVLGGIAASGYGVAWLAVIFALASLGAWVGLRLVFGKPGAAAQTFEHDVND